MRRILKTPTGAVIGTLLGVLLIFVMLQALVLDRPGLDPAPPREKTPAQVRDELRQADREKLETYGWVDRERGRVRIPIDRAIEKLLAEQEGR